MSIVQKIKDFIKAIIFKFINPPFVPASYSQAGEDCIVKFLFADKKMHSFQYLDIGTNKPDLYNNTYLFYLNGSSGVCVEADTSLIDEIKQVRPNDKIINAGVSVSDSVESEFYIFDIKGINTFDKEEAIKRESFGTHTIKEIVKVPLIHINQLIKQNFSRYPDFMSIDIEGLDFEVLKSLDFEIYPISVICVETCFYSESHIRPKDNRIIDFMLSKGYEIYADTYINSIFVKKDWFYA